LTAVLRHGRRHRTPRLDISWRGNEIGHPRLGVVVPRYGRTAVARNRLRRRVREIARREVLAGVGAVDLVIKARSAAYASSFGDLAAELTSWARSRSA
jgi:ribonuclease P protein component